MNLLLLTLAATSYMFGDERAAIVIAIMVLLSVSLGFFQEHRSTKAADALRHMVQTHVTVRRQDGGTGPEASDGHAEVPIGQIVPGDIVLLSAGDIIPADIRLISAKDLFVNQSTLTGEAMPLEKHTQSHDGSAETPFDLPNICFMGSAVVSGVGSGVVVLTAAQTAFGQVAGEIAGNRVLTSFDKGINRVTGRCSASSPSWCRWCSSASGVPSSAVISSMRESAALWSSGVLIERMSTMSLHRGSVDSVISSMCSGEPDAGDLGDVVELNDHAVMVAADISSAKRPPSKVVLCGESQQKYRLIIGVGVPHVARPFRGRGIRWIIIDMPWRSSDRGQQNYQSKNRSPVLFAKEAASIVVAGCLCLICGAVHADDGMPAIWRKWEPWAEIGGYAANHAEARRGETALWAPLMQGGDYLLFTDIRAKLFDEQQEEGNFALGYRQMLSSGWNLGVWASYDRRWSGTGKAFEQIAVGTEALSPNWDVRVNGYIPLKDSKMLSNTVTGSGATTLELVDDSLYFITAPQTRTDVTELAFWGIDAEVGLRVPLGTDLDRATDLRIFLGGYYFDNDRFAEPITGPRLRAEWRINDILPNWHDSRLTFEASYSNDDARNDEIRAGASLRIPLGVATVAERELTPQELRMKEGLKRDTDIVTQVQTQVTAIPGSREHVEDTATGVDLVHAIIVSNGSNLQGAVDGVGEDALIIAEGGASMFGVVALANNQTLLGGGGSIQVRGLNTGRLATYTAPGTRPTIFLPKGTDYQNITIGIETANNSHVSNFTLENIAPTSTAYIVGMRVGSNQTVVIDNMIFDRMQWSVNVLGTGANVTLRNSVTSGTAEDIVIDGGLNTIVADNNVFGANYKVVSIFNGENDIAIRNNTFAAGNVFHLFAFQNSDVYVKPGSTGNINLATPYFDYCGVLNATLFGSIEFTNRAPITQADCGPLH